MIRFRVVPLIVAALLSLFNSAAVSAQKLVKPKNLDEAYVALNTLLSDTITYTFKTLPEDVSVRRLNMLIGMQMRNSWKLWRRSKFQKFFRDLGVLNPDEMSKIIFTSYHRHLNNKPILLDSQIRHITWIRKNTKVVGNVVYVPADPLTSDEELLKYFPYGTKVIFSQNEGASKIRFLYMGVVINHDSKLLNVKIETINPTGSQKIIGDTMSIGPLNCYIIPPKIKSNE